MGVWSCREYYSDSTMYAWYADTSPQGTCWSLVSTRDMLEFSLHKGHVGVWSPQGTCWSLVSTRDMLEFSLHKGHVGVWSPQGTCWSLVSTRDMLEFGLVENTKQCTHGTSPQGTCWSRTDPLSLGGCPFLRGKKCTITMGSGIKGGRTSRPRTFFGVAKVFLSSNLQRYTPNQRLPSFKLPLQQHTTEK